MVRPTLALFFIHQLPGLALFPDSAQHGAESQYVQRIHPETYAPAYERPEESPPATREEIDSEQPILTRTKAVTWV